MTIPGAKTILVTGGRGQLGSALAAAAGSDLHPDLDLVAIDKSDADIRDADAMEDLVRRIRPDVIVNAAAYTAVDECEDDIDTAMSINGEAPGTIAAICRRLDLRMVQISTDYVFDGTADAPIRVDSNPAPLSVYGRSKLAGEIACRDRLGDDALILRTSWLYAAGHRNFVSTMLRLMRSREEIGVVGDQIGTPTWSRSLAEGVLRLVDSEAGGIHHLTDSGVASWFDFAIAIRDIGLDLGLLERTCQVREIATADYPVRASRPLYSVLDKSSAFEAMDWETPGWRECLGRCLGEWSESGSRGSIDRRTPDGMED